MRRAFGIAIAVAFGGCGKTVTPCEAPGILCGETCVDLANDNANCGECDNPCGAGQICGNGLCAAECPAGQTACSGMCFDLQTDADHCGDCTTMCTAANECRAGACVPRCDTFLTAPIEDPWGTYWDSLERSALTFEEARLMCESFGGRLPTATEGYRVSPARTGSVGESFHVNEIWTLAPHDLTQQATVRLSDGTVLEQPVVDVLPYRCVCPAASPIAFNGADCNGPPGDGCFATTTLGARYNVDKWDRPAMRKSSAVWECGFDEAHVANYVLLVEVVLQGLPEGSGQYLVTGDDTNYYAATTLRWSGTTTAATWGPLPSNTSYLDTKSLAPFRCAGLDYAAPPRAIPGTHVGHSYAVDAADNPVGTFAIAHDVCWDRGGHLARSTELAELIFDGLPGGSNEFQWTADQGGYNGASFLSVWLKWTGVAQRFTYAYYGNASDTMNWGYKSNTPGQPFRCIYYPIDASYQPPTTCNGGCSSFTPPGTTAVITLDAEDRGAATWRGAADACRQVGGVLASERDLTEAIRHGLPNGRGDYVWTADLSSTVAMIVRWTGIGTTAYLDVYSTDMTYAGLDDLHEFRCLWTNELR